MKSLFHGLTGLLLLGADIYSIKTGFIPNRGGSGGIYVAESPEFFWLSIVIFAGMGIALLIHAWRNWSGK